MNKKNENPAGTIMQASHPGKMRADIMRVFESIPDDTRDIIAQFWVLTLQEQLPKWKLQGETARKANKSRPGGVDADPGGIAPAT